MGKNGKNSSIFKVIVAIMIVVVLVIVGVIGVAVSKNLLGGEKTHQVVSGEGIVDFGGRSIKINSAAKQRIEVNTTTVSPQALDSLNTLPVSGIVSSPFVLTVPEEQEPTKVTITRDFDKPLPDDTTAVFVYFDEVNNRWVPEPSTLSPDRRSMEANINPQGTWSDVVLGGAPGLENVKKNVQGKKRLIPGAISAGDPLEKSGFVSPEFTTIPLQCSEQVPEWAKDIDTASAGERYGLETCIGSNPQDDNELTMQVANTSLVPIKISMEGEPVDFAVTNVSSPLDDETLASFEEATNYQPEGSLDDGHRTVWVLPGYRLDVNYQHSSIGRADTSLYTIVPKFQEDSTIMYSYLKEYLRAINGELSQAAADFVYSLTDPNIQRLIDTQYTNPAELFSTFTPKEMDSYGILYVRPLLIVVIDFLYRYHAFDHIGSKDEGNSAQLTTAGTEFKLVEAFDTEGNLASGVEDRGEDNSMSLFFCSAYNRRGGAMILTCSPNAGGYHVCYHTPSMEDDQVACMWDYIHPFIKWYRVNDQYQVPEDLKVSARSFKPLAIELENGLVCEPYTASMKDAETPLWYCRDKEGNSSELGVYSGPRGTTTESGIDKSGPQWYAYVRKPNRVNGLAFSEEDYERSANTPTERMKIVRAYAPGWKE